MSGETEKQISGWTVDTLKEFVEQQIADIRNESDRRFSAQEKAVETAFNAAKEAVIKSEIGVEKRSDSVYVTITKLQDALAAVMPRAEAEQRFTSLTEKVNEGASKTTRSEGSTQGSDKTVRSIVTAISVVGTILGILVLLATGVFN